MIFPLIVSCAYNYKVLEVPSEKQSPEMFSMLWDVAINKSIDLGYVINREKIHIDEGEKEIDLYRIFSGSMYYINIRESKEGIAVSGYVKGEWMNIIISSDVQNIYEAVKMAGGICNKSHSESIRKGGRVRLSEDSDICW